jgi:hypothetical protein
MYSQILRLPRKLIFTERDKFIMLLQTRRVAAHFMHILSCENCDLSEHESLCDELITRPGCPADCPRSSNRNRTENFMEAAKAQNWAVKPQGKKLHKPGSSN